MMGYLLNISLFELAKLKQGVYNQLRIIIN